MARLDARLGKLSRRWVYEWGVQHPAELAMFWQVGLSPHQRDRAQALAPVVAVLVRARCAIRPKAHAATAGLITQELNWVSSLLAERRYLVGESFGAADLTLAALSGPALQSPGYGGPNLSLPPTSDAFAADVELWRATPAGEHALRVYREHRLDTTRGV